MLMNERYAFVIANRFGPTRGYKNIARAFLARDGNTGAWDGEHVYYYIDEIQTFGLVYERLLKLSPVLMYDNCSVNIIHSKSTLPS